MGLLGLHIPIMQRLLQQSLSIMQAPSFGEQVSVGDFVGDILGSGVGESVAAGMVGATVGPIVGVVVGMGGISNVATNWVSLSSTSIK